MQRACWSALEVVVSEVPPLLLDLALYLLPLALDAIPIHV